MKVAAARAIALLAREDVPDEVVSAYGGDRPKYGRNYIIPSTFDPRLISVIPSAVARAAMKSGVARKKIEDFDLYKDQLTNRLDPSMSIMQGINAKVRKKPKSPTLGSTPAIPEKAIASGIIANATTRPARTTVNGCGSK